jgi:hypothetical protein
VRRRVIRWFRRSRLLDAAAAADMLAWENSGFSVDASVRITLIDRDVPSYFRSLEHLLRYCARPPFALERLSVIRGPDGRIIRVRYVLPRHKAATWVERGRGRKSTRPGANGVVELSPFEFLDRLVDLVPPPRKHRHRYHGVFAPNHKLLCAAAGVTAAADTPSASRPRLGGISFLHRFGSALNHHVHLHACVTDGVFVPAAAEAGTDAPPTFLPARPVTAADLAALTERVRRRVIRWFRLARLLDAAAAADMLAWENSGFSVDASVRITLIDRDVPSYFQSLEHLLRYCARPPFALERLSVIRDADGRIIRVRYVLPRHKAATWVGPGRSRKSTRPGANGVVELTPFEFLNRLADLVPPPRKHRHRYHGVFAPNHRLRKAVTALAIGNVGTQREATASGDGNDGHATGGCRDANPNQKPRSHDTSRIAWAKLMARVGEEFPLECPACGGDIRLISFITEPGPIRKILTHLGEPLEPPPISPARGPPTDWGELVQAHDDRDVFQSSPDELPAIDIHSL